MRHSQFFGVLFGSGTPEKEGRSTKRIVLSGLVGLVLALGLFAIATTPPALAFDWWGDRDPIREVVIKGADLHLSRQGTYTNACGSGYGPPDVPEINSTWEWLIGSGQTCWNVGGISALGLLAAYQRTHNQHYLRGAIAQGNTLVAKYNMIVTNDPNGAGWEDRPFSQDIEFLVLLSQTSHKSSYARVARDWYRIITDNKTAEENANRYIDARLSLAGWDLASHIRAAVAVGEWHYAQGMARRLVERRSDWEGKPLGGYDYTMSSYASLLWAFEELWFAGHDIVAAERDFLEMVLQAQAQDGPQKGSWEDGDYQTTAYAILGLDAVKVRGRDLRHDVATALGKAFSYLRDTQTEEGGWRYPPPDDVEYGEVNSEVLLALGGLQEREIAGRLVDPAPGGTQKPAATPAK